MLTQSQVKELFLYRDDGVLVRKKTISSKAQIGHVAGGKNLNGYIVISIKCKIYCAHRLIWLWHYGYVPENDIDHINRDRSDNRIENLREVSRSCNTRNTGNYITNKSGVKGVHWYKPQGKWAAQIGLNGKIVNIGYYTDFLDAVCARLAAEQAIGWAGCDDCSPAFQYVKANISHV